MIIQMMDGSYYVVKHGDDLRKGYLELLARWIDEHGGRKPQGLEELYDVSYMPSNLRTENPYAQNWANIAKAAEAASEFTDEEEYKEKYDRREYIADILVKESVDNHFDDKDLKWITEETIRDFGISEEDVKFYYKNLAALVSKVNQGVVPIRNKRRLKQQRSLKIEAKENSLKGGISIPESVLNKLAEKAAEEKAAEEARKAAEEARKAAEEKAAEEARKAAEEAEKTTDGVSTEYNELEDYSDEDYYFYEETNDAPEDETQFEVVVEPEDETKSEDEAESVVEMESEDETESVAEAVTDELQEKEDKPCEKAAELSKKEIGPQENDGEAESVKERKSKYHAFPKVGVFANYIRACREKGLVIAQTELRELQKNNPGLYPNWEQLQKAGFYASYLDIILGVPFNELRQRTRVECQRKKDFAEGCIPDIADAEKILLADKKSSCGSSFKKTNWAHDESDLLAIPKEGEESIPKKSKKQKAAIKEVRPVVEPREAEKDEKTKEEAKEEAEMSNKEDNNTKQIIVEEPINNNPTTAVVVEGVVKMVEYDIVTHTRICLPEGVKGMTLTFPVTVTIN